MADVFLAQDLKYERAVALKVLRPELSASLGAARFLQEIQIAARLHHPHILPLYDSDEADGLLYYVMPYVEGESLRERLARERQLPVDEALQIAREVADALSYAHSCGVVRELVPEAVDAAVKKALATLPADRFMSAARFAEALGTPVTVAIAVGTAQAMLHDITVARSVAVLPFENMSADPENEYFSDGVTDDIISTLSKIAALKVVCRTSTMQYKKTGKRIAAIAEELGVATILEGSVRRAGPRGRIVARLVDPRTAKQLWGETYDRQLLDVFEVQSELAHQIAGALATALSPEEKRRLEKKPTDQAEAYNLYLLGRYHANKWSEAEVQKAIGHFEGAIAKDPGYALAYAGLADAHELLSIGLSSKPATECLAQAKAMALKALELDDSLAEAHTSLAYARWLGDLDWRGAEREFRRALELSASYVTAHQWFAEYLAALGRHAEALVEIKRAQQLDPLSVPVNRAVGWVLYYARRYDEAIEEFQKTLEMDPDFLGALDLDQSFGVPSER